MGRKRAYREADERSGVSWGEGVEGKKLPRVLGNRDVVTISGSWAILPLLLLRHSFGLLFFVLFVIFDSLFPEFSFFIWGKSFFLFPLIQNPVFIQDKNE